MTFRVNYDIGRGVHARQECKSVDSAREALDFVRKIKREGVREVYINDADFRRHYTEAQLEELARAEGS